MANMPPKPSKRGPGKRVVTKPVKMRKGGNGRKR